MNNRINNIIAEKNNKITFSIIIPCYNSAKYITKCIDSILEQNMNDIEIICINDGSTDNTQIILENYYKKDERINIYWQNHYGVGTARNKALRIAKGKYVCFVDSDDYLENNFFDKCIKEISDYPDIIIFGCKTLDNKTQKIRTGQYSCKNFSKHISSKNLFKFHTICTNKIYKREFLLNNKIFFSNTLTGEEQAFFVKNIIFAQKIKIIKEDLYYYRKNRKNSLTSTKIKKDLSPIRITSEIIHFLNSIELEYYLKIKIISRYYKKCLTWYCKTHDSYKQEYYENLKKISKYICESKYIYWWNYYKLEYKTNYSQFIMNYINSILIYFVREMMFIPLALILFFANIFLDTEDRDFR